MTKQVEPIPSGYHTINVYIALNNATKAIQYYKEAFGAVEDCRFEAPDGKIMFAELKIGDSTLQLSDEFFEHEFSIRSPHTLKGTNCIIHLYVPDVDTVFKSAINAGAKVKKELEDMFWGDRYCQLEDPFGYIWSISTRIRNITHDQIKQSLAQMKPEK